VSTLLIDASVILAAFDQDDGEHADSCTVLADTAATLATLDLARFEVANVAVCSWHAPSVVDNMLSAIERIGEDGGVIASTHALLRSAALLALEHGISVYDASYAAAARQGGLELVSCDLRDLVGKGLARTPSQVRSGAR